MSQRQAYTGPRGRQAPKPVEIDAFSQRPVDEEISLRDCAREADIRADDLLVFEAEARRVAAGLPPGTRAPGPLDPSVVYRSDAFRTLARLARVIAGPEGSGREVKVRGYLRRLILEERRQAGASPPAAELDAAAARDFAAGAPVELEEPEAPEVEQ